MARKGQATSPETAAGPSTSSAAPAPPAPVERSDSRSLEELLSFIDGGGGASGASSSAAATPAAAAAAGASSSAAKKKKKKAKGSSKAAEAGGSGHSWDAERERGDLAGGAHLDQQQRTSSLGPSGAELAQLLANKPVDQLMDELFPEDGFEDSGGCPAPY